MIETERLLLKPLVDADADSIATKINNYEISKNLARVPFPYTRDDADEFLQWCKGLDGRSCFMTLRLRSAPDDLIGVISYDWVDEKQYSELGYWMVQEHWGKGLMTEAARAMVDHAFANAGIETLSTCYFDENPASGRVLRKAGFETEGHCAHFSRARNCEVPVTTMCLTRAQWLNKKAAS